MELEVEYPILARASNTSTLGASQRRPLVVCTDVLQAREDFGPVGGELLTRHAESSEEARLCESCGEPIVV